MLEVKGWWGETQRKALCVGAQRTPRQMNRNRSNRQEARRERLEIGYIVAFGEGDVAALAINSLQGVAIRSGLERGIVCTRAWHFHARMWRCHHARCYGREQPDSANQGHEPTGSGAAGVIA